MFYDDWKPYVPVAERRRQAMREMEKRRKKGIPVSPVVIEGKTIARTFWGKAWCDNLESYSDFENRLPRGRTYVRNGSVVDLQIEPGKVEARVAGSELYTVKLTIAPTKPAHWKSICKDCAGGIDSLVELLQGRFSKGVMERLCRQGGGLFPTPKEIELSCSCPDWASMCKHVAAVLYGIGARLDEQPELLFRLRQVDEKELIAQAGKDVPLSKEAPEADKVLDDAGLSELFGIELAAAPTQSEAAPKRRRAAKAAAKEKPVAVPAKKARAVKAKKRVAARKAPATRAAAKAKALRKPARRAARSGSAAGKRGARRG